jgi:uncharacterized protein YndB with AHSA1/START domain
MKPSDCVRLVCTAVTAGLVLARMNPARAEVVESGPNGFALQRTVHIAATPERIYAALVLPAKWWNSAHTFSGSAANLTLDARAGGCFCESWNGGSVQHLVVVNAIAGKTLRLRGALGPFQGQGADGALTFMLKSAGDGTDLTMENIVGGYMKGGFAKWPPLADSMLAEQMIRLKRYIETGTPEPASK